MPHQSSKTAQLTFPSVAASTLEMVEQCRADSAIYAKAVEIKVIISGAALLSIPFECST